MTIAKKKDAHVLLQTVVDPETARWVRDRAKGRDQSTAAYLRSLIRWAKRMREEQRKKGAVIVEGGP